MTVSLHGQAAPRCAVLPCLMIESRQADGLMHIKPAGKAGQPWFVPMPGTRHQAELRAIPFA